MSKNNTVQYLSRRSFLASSSLAMLTYWVHPSFGQSKPAVSFEILRRGVGVFIGRGGTIGWMASPDAAIVIDSQFPATAEECLKGINERSGNRTIDYLINTHHHGDHTAGNSVFRSKVNKIVSHENVPVLLKKSAARNPDNKPTIPDTTFSKKWSADLGKEVVTARYYGPAHTSGDSTIHFENANIVHMGDLVFNRRQPFIDRPAGARIQGWIKVLENVVADHDSDTLYIFGHSNPGFKITGSGKDLLYQRDYFTALFEYTKGQIKSGKSRDSFIASTPELKGFSDHGPLNERVLNVAYDEVKEAG